MRVATAAACVLITTAVSLTGAPAFAAGSTTAPAAVPAASCGDLAQGSTGTAISTIQAMLGVSADGDFGPATAKALTAWQTTAKISATGVIDPATWAAMPEATSWRACGEAVAAVTPSGVKLHCSTLKSGSSGPAVAVLQRALGVSVDGGYGKKTKQAVELARAQSGLGADGPADRKIWKVIALTGTPACEPGSSSSTPPTSSGSGTPPTKSKQPKDEKRQRKIRRQVDATVAELTDSSNSTTPPAPDAITGAALAFARKQLGKPYVYGAVGPTSYDCSGLALASYDAAALPMPRTAADQYIAGVKVPLAKVRPGDLVYWGSDVTKGTTIYHTAIYVGSGEILDAPETGEDVHVQELWSTDLFPHAVRPLSALSLPVGSGATGATVTDLQTALDHHGFTISIDGGFGASTETAVKAWQTKHSFTATGVVTAKEWPSLGWKPARPTKSER